MKPEIVTSLCILVPLAAIATAYFLIKYISKNSNKNLPQDPKEADCIDTSDEIAEATAFASAELFDCGDNAPLGDEHFYACEATMLRSPRGRDFPGNYSNSNSNADFAAQWEQRIHKHSKKAKRMLNAIKSKSNAFDLWVRVSGDPINGNCDDSSDDDGNAGPAGESCNGGYADEEVVALPSRIAVQLLCPHELKKGRFVLRSLQGQHGSHQVGDNFSPGYSSAPSLRSPATRTPLRNSSMLSPGLSRRQNQSPSVAPLGSKRDAYHPQHQHAVASDDTVAVHSSVSSVSSISSSSLPHSSVSTPKDLRLEISAYESTHSSNSRLYTQPTSEASSSVSPLSSRSGSPISLHPDSAASRGSSFNRRVQNSSSVRGSEQLISSTTASSSLLSNTGSVTQLVAPGADVVTPPFQLHSGDSVSSSHDVRSRSSQPRKENLSVHAAGVSPLSPSSSSSTRGRGSGWVCHRPLVVKKTVEDTMNDSIDFINTLSPQSGKIVQRNFYSPSL